MGSLYDLTREYDAVLDAIMSADAGDDVAGLLSQLDEIDEAWDAKAEGYARFLREVEARAEMAKAEAARLTERKRRLEATAEGLKIRMKTAMKARGLAIAETPIGTWKIGKGRESVEIIDASKIPAEYLIHQAPTVSKTAIMAAYKADGEIVPGTEIVRNESFGLK